MARALVSRAGRPFEASFAGRDSLDLSRIDAIAPFIKAARPDVVINAAAYTAVDAAEADRTAAFLLNRDAPAAIASCCAELGVPMVHVSTDFVFDGAKGAPYVEADPVNPLGVYGQSKAEGEGAVLGAGVRAAVVRSSWVYGAHGRNFVLTMLRLGAERGFVRVVDDQLGRPTFVNDLADALLTITQALLDGDRRVEGLIHYANSGEATWADLAEAALEGVARVERITTAEYPTPVRRPADSRLDLSRFTAFAGAPPPDWRDGLARCLGEVRG